MVLSARWEALNRNPWRDGCCRLAGPPPLQAGLRWTGVWRQGQVIEALTILQKVEQSRSCSSRWRSALWVHKASES